jgi:glycosyltransferase involved in cell wall biosynthesis
MKCENIICFAKDWGEQRTSNHHVMLELAKHNRVLWLNSLSTRKPNLGSGRDLSKIVNKLLEFGRGPTHVEAGLWKFTPIVLPLPHNPYARAINKQVLRATVAFLRRQLGMDHFQLWTFLPNVSDYIGAFGEDLVVYYCVDEWSLFSYLDTESIVRAENSLCAKADVIFATASALADKKRLLNPNTHLASHGVDHALFARALDDDTPIPADVATLPRPILGFYGTLQDWIDQELLCKLADANPDGSVVLIGSELVDTSMLRQRSNVHILDQRSHDQLPAYCKAFDVGLIPYRIEERMLFVNPTKLREYLSAGLPVVSTALPEVERYSEHCVAAADHDAFIAGVAQVLRDDSPALRQRRSDAMRDETWEKKVHAVGETVAATLRDKRS